MPSSNYASSISVHNTLAVHSKVLKVSFTMKAVCFCVDCVCMTTCDEICPALTKTGNFFGTFASSAIS